MDQAGSPKATGVESPVGIYTKTVIQSSVVHWILHARIRNQKLNDVVFVGEDFIQVKQVGHEGRLLHVATKTDFDARILAAATFRHDHDPADEDFLVKLEKDTAPFDRTAVAPQSIVLTLSSNALVFVFLRILHNGTHTFVQQTCPLPAFDRLTLQLGHHLAVDPFSRAVAVAAMEREVLFYTANSKEQTQREIKHHMPDWCPVGKQRAVHIDGVIQHANFLIPRSDDADHIILLLIVTDQQRTKAVRIDWHYSNGPHHAQLHPGQALDSVRMVSNLMIPLQDAAFLLVTGSEITLWKDILSGSATDLLLSQPDDEPPRHPAISSHAPIWTSWAKPRRSQAARRSNDYVYMVREDGVVLLLTIPKSSSVGFQLSIAGDLECHIDTAFASLGGEGDPDILCVAGENSAGKVVSIGHWPSLRRIDDVSRMETMSMQVAQLLPNWASSIDLISSAKLTRSSGDRVKDMESVLVTSGRQPYGTVTEIRQGFEARLSAFLELEGLRTVTDVWALPDVSSGSFIIVLSSPTSTRILAAGAEFDEIDEIGDAAAFDAERRTLAAGITLTGQLVQVNAKTICVTTTMHANFEDTTRETLEDGTAVIVASVLQETSIILTAQRKGDSHAIVSYQIASAESEAAIIQRGHFMPMATGVLSMCGAIIGDRTLVMAATENGHVALICFRPSGGPPAFAESLPTTLSHDPAVCDHVAILQTPDGCLLGVCGLRDGTLLTFVIDVDASEPLSRGVSVNLGVSTVKLIAVRSDKSSLIATSGGSTYLLQWKDTTLSTLSIDTIWITDKSRPEFRQGPVVACAEMPSAAYLSSDTLADSLIMISDGELLVTSLDSSSSTVPRQISVSSTPNRLVYAESLRHLVCSGPHAELHFVPSRGQTQTRKRRIWTTLDFIPVKGDVVSYTHHMQPGERVNALVSWSFRASSEKKYSYIITGGSHVRSSGHHRGRVTFLQPVVKDWQIVDVREIRHISFDDEVSALALYDSTTYIACAGDQIHAQRLNTEDMKWDQLCPPFKLASPAVYITIEELDGDKRIVVSSSKDSIIVLQLQIAADDMRSAALVPVAMSPRADVVLSHMVISPTYPATTILTSTKYGQIFGLSYRTPAGISPQQHTSTPLLFEAQLPRSLTRLLPCPQPARIGSPPAGLLSERITSSATDGAVVNLVLINEELQRKLFWLQRLVEWSEELSPHLAERAPYLIEGDENRHVAMGVGRTRNVMVGFGAGQKGGANRVSLPLKTSLTKLNDMHINGDILARVLTRRGIEALKSVLKENVLGKDSGFDVWAQESWDGEMKGLEEAVEWVRTMDEWLG